MTRAALNLLWSMSGGLARPKRLDEVVQFDSRGFVAGECAEEGGQMGGQFCVRKNVVRDAARIHGGVLEDLEPVARAGLKAELSCSGAWGFLVARRPEDFALDLAPVAGVVAKLQAKLTQAGPPARFDRTVRSAL